MLKFSTQYVVSESTIVTLLKAVRCRFTDWLKISREVLLVLTIYFIYLLLKSYNSTQ